MNDIIIENEERANKWAFLVLGLLIVMGITIQIVYYTAFSKVETLWTIGQTAGCFGGMLIALAIPKSKYYLKKYIIIATLIITVCAHCSTNITALFLMYLIPLVVSCRYYDNRLLYYTGALTLVSMLVILLLNAKLGFTVDANLLTLKPNTAYTIVTDNYGWFQDSLVDLSEDHLHDNIAIVLPQTVLFLVIYFTAFVGISRSGISMMEKREQLTRERTLIERDIKNAANVQLEMLPVNFDTFGGEQKVSIYASMNAAKNVGGDFYDFFMLDDNKMCLAIGDVSGKGMPAALFMVRTLTNLRGITKTNIKPNEILYRLNNLLAQSNTEMMFVTLWLGILDLETGYMEYAVGGHNPPLIMSGGSEYKYLTGETNCLVGAISDVEFSMASLQMNHGDKILLYTDGVTECMNKDSELYGESRFIEFVNGNTTLSPSQMLGAVSAQLTSYAGEAEQSDDITMLCLEYK